MLLSGVNGPADDLKNVSWSAPAAIFDSDGNTDYMRGTKVASGARGNRGDKAAIRETAGANFNGFEQPWEGATRADRIRQISVSENDGLAVGQVRGHHGHGDFEVFEAARFEHTLDEIAQPVIAGKPQTGNAPPGDVTKTDRTAGGDDARERRAAGISRAENAAHACARDIRDRDVILFEDLQDAEMGKAARKSAAQSEAQSCPSGQGRWPSVPFGMIGTCHDIRMSSTDALPNGPCVLKKRYERTSVPDRNKYYADETAVPTY